MDYKYVILILLSLVSILHIVSTIPLSIVSCDCPSGQGVHLPCDNSTSVVCEDCKGGYYSSEPSETEPCQLCDNCDEGWFEVNSCNSTHNTVCEECTLFNNSTNVDFLKKCVDKENDNLNETWILENVPNITESNRIESYINETSEVNDLMFNNTSEDLAEEVIINTNFTKEQDIDEINLNNTLIIDEDLEIDGSGDDEEQLSSVKNLNETNYLGEEENTPIFTNDDDDEQNNELTEENLESEELIPASESEEIKELNNSKEQIEERVDGEENESNDNEEKYTVTTADSNGVVILNADEIKEPTATQTKASTSVFSIIMAALTSGIIFFAIGFWFTKCRRKKAVYSPSIIRNRNTAKYSLENFDEEPIYRSPGGIYESTYSPIQSSSPQPVVCYKLESPLEEEEEEENETNELLKRKSEEEDTMKSKASSKYNSHSTESLKKEIDLERSLVDEIDNDLNKSNPRADYRPVKDDVIIPKTVLPENEEPPIYENNDVANQNSNHPDASSDPPLVNGDVIPKENVNGLYASPSPIEEVVNNDSYQSPVNIDTNITEVDEKFEKNALTFFYVPSNTKNITNTGSVISIDVDGRGSLLVGGPVASKRFCLHHIDLHWGSHDNVGSEHSIDGKYYAGEIQLVHWNRDDYNSYEEAAIGDEGLAIMAVFLQVNEIYHHGFGAISRSVPSIRYKNQSCEMITDFDPALILPENSFDYWTYPGSLTTTPYTENVTWIIFKCPIVISKDQIMALRRTKKCEERFESRALLERRSTVLIDNYRRECPLGGRVVRASFI